jgi:ABC-type transporter Mla subunit MlaD
VGPEQQEKVQSIIDRVGEIVDTFYASLESTDAQVQEILASADRVSADFESIVSRVSGQIDGWNADVTDTLENIRAGSDQIEPMLADADLILADAQAALDSMQAMIDDNRPQIDAIIDNVETTTVRVNEETLPLVNRTIEEYQQPAREATAAVNDIRVLLAEEIPNLRRTIANMRLASDQMKLTLAEVRAAPWRLLERPTTRELEAQLFYDAARTYATAVSDLRAASEALSSARASGAASAEDLAGLLEHLEGAFETYEAAELRLLEGIPRTQPE